MGCCLVQCCVGNSGCPVSGDGCMHSSLYCPCDEVCHWSLYFNGDSCTGNACRWRILHRRVGSCCQGRVGNLLVRYRLNFRLYSIACLIYSNFHPFDKGMNDTEVLPLRYKSGAMYEGWWKENVKHGFGVYHYANGGRFEGQFSNGKRNGIGIRIWPHGRVKVCLKLDCDGAPRSMWSSWASVLQTIAG